VLLAAAPLEGCALLLGRRHGTDLELRRIWPCCNRWQPAEQRRQRFLLDPREQLQAQRWARQRDLLVLGAAHSHPTGPAVPSATDRQLCLGPTLMLIRSGLTAGGASGGAGALEPWRAWWLPDAADQPARELPLRLAEGAGHLGE